MPPILIFAALWVTTGFAVGLFVGGWLKAMSLTDDRRHVDMLARRDRHA